MKLPSIYEFNRPSKACFYWIMISLSQVFLTPQRRKFALSQSQIWWNHSWKATKPGSTVSLIPQSQNEPVVNTTESKLCGVMESKLFFVVKNGPRKVWLHCVLDFEESSQKVLLTPSSQSFLSVKDKSWKVWHYCVFKCAEPNFFLTLLYWGSPGTYFACVRKYLASFPRTLYGAGPATDWNVIERCGFGNLPATVCCMINSYRKSERARTRHPPHSVWRRTGNWLECWLAPPSGGGGAHRGKFLPRLGEIGATEWRRGLTFDVKSLKMYVKTSFFDVEHEVRKDSFFVSAGIDIV